MQNTMNKSFIGSINMKNNKVQLLKYQHWFEVFVLSISFLFYG